MANNSQSKPTKTVVLMGMTGAGKSRFGNFLLDKEGYFQTQGGLLSITHGPKSGETEWNGRHLSVVDTPGMNDAWEGQNMDRTLKHIAEGIRKANGGADAICYVMDVAKRFTNGEAKILQYLSDAGNLWPHVIIIFTHAGLVGKTTAEQETYLADVLKSEQCPSGFKDLVKNTQRRYVLFEAENMPKEYLTEKIKLVYTRILEVYENTKGEKYTNKLFQDVIEIFNETQDSEEKEEKSQISSQELSNRTATIESMPEQECKNSSPVTQTGKNIKETAAGEKKMPQNVPEPPTAMEKHKPTPKPKDPEPPMAIEKHNSEPTPKAKDAGEKKLPQNVPKPPMAIEKHNTEPTPKPKDAVATSTSDLEEKSKKERQREQKKLEKAISRISEEKISVSLHVVYSACIMSICI